MLSRMEAVCKAIRQGILDLINPVMTLTVGRCVAMMRWIPAARPSCAKRMMCSSTSNLLVSMRSASSSITTTNEDKPMSEAFFACL